MEKHQAIIKGQTLKLKYYPYRYQSFEMYRDNTATWMKRSKEDFVKWDEIWTGEINSPLLEVGELFYIVDLELKVRITERIRTTSGSYIYETDHIIEVIEDEETRESEEETDKYIAESQRKEKEEKDEKYEETLAHIRKYEEPQKERTWFEKWFG